MGERSRPFWVRGRRVRASSTERVSSLVEKEEEEMRKSATSILKNSYDTLVRVAGSTRICSLKMRILQIAINEHGLESNQLFSH